MSDESGASEGASSAPATPAEGAPAAPAAEAPWYGVFGENPELSGPTKINEYKSAQDFLGAYNSAQDLISRSIRIPTAEAGEEVWNAFKDKLKAVPGVMSTPEGYSPPPESPDGYQFAEVEGWEVEAGDDKALAEVAHKLGMTNDQLNGIRGHLIDSLKTTQAKNSETFEAAMTQLEQDWGTAFERKLNDGQKVVKAIEVSNPGFTDFLTNTLTADGIPLAEHPTMLRVFSELARRTGAEPPATDPGEPGPLGLTKAEAEAKIADAWNNRENHPAYQPTHPGHQTAKAELDRWYSIARGQ